MVVYLINFFLVFSFGVFASFKKDYEKYFNYFVFLLLFLLAGSRSEFVDRDYKSYLFTFHNLLSSKEYFSNGTYLIYEPLYYFIPFLSNKFFNSFYLVFVLFAFLGVWLKLKSFYLTNSYLLSILLYCNTWFLLHEMTQIRAGVAIGFLCLSIKDIYDKNPKKFLLKILLASLFHYSSLVFIPIYFLSAHSFKKWKYMLLIAVCVAMAFLKINILNTVFTNAFSDTKVEYYNAIAESDAKNWNVWNIGFLINLFMTTLLVIKASTLRQHNKYFILMLKINIISIVAYLLLAAIPIFAIRLNELFGTVQMFLFPTVIFLFRNKVFGYIWIIGLSLFYYFIYFYYSKIIGPYSVWW